MSWLRRISCVVGLTLVAGVAPADPSLLEIVQGPAPSMTQAQAANFHVSLVSHVPESVFLDFGLERMRKGSWHPQHSALWAIDGANALDQVAPEQRRDRSFRLTIGPDNKLEDGNEYRLVIRALRLKEKRDLAEVDRVTTASFRIEP
jgi:hypothetical protein